MMTLRLGSILSPLPYRRVAPRMGGFKVVPTADDEVLLETSASWGSKAQVGSGGGGTLRVSGRWWLRDSRKWRWRPAPA